MNQDSRSATLLNLEVLLDSTYLGRQGKGFVKARVKKDYLLSARHSLLYEHISISVVSLTDLGGGLATKKHTNYRMRVQLEYLDPQEPSSLSGDDDDVGA